MNFNILISQILIIFFLIVIGYCCKKRSILNVESTKGFTKFVINISIPFAIISSFNQSLPKSALKNVGLIFILTIIIYLVSIVLGQILFKKFHIETQKVMKYTTVFSNCAFMGFPILESLMGKIGILYGSVYIVVSSIFLWTYGEGLFLKNKEKKNIKNIFLNPGILSIFIGIVVFFLSSQIPSFLSKSINILGGTTTPISMIVIGSMLADLKVNDIYKGSEIYYISFIRLVFLPVIVILILKYFHFNKDIIIVCGILTAMPAPANVAMFAEEFDSNTALASKIIFISTILSIITIPMMSFLL